MRRCRPHRSRRPRLWRRDMGLHAGTCWPFPSAMRPAAGTAGDRRHTPLELSRRPSNATADDRGSEKAERQLVARITHQSLNPILKARFVEALIASDGIEDRTVPGPSTCTSDLCLPSTAYDVSGVHVAHMLAPLAGPVGILDTWRRICHVASVAMSVFAAADDVMMREGVKGMPVRGAGVHVVGVTEDYESLGAGAEAAAPDASPRSLRASCV